MKYEATNKISNSTYCLEDDRLTITVRKKLIYDGTLDGIILLHMGINQKAGVVLFVLSLPEREQCHIDSFRRLDFEAGCIFLQALAERCEFADMGYWKASFCTRSKLFPKEAPESAPVPEPPKKPEPAVPSVPEVKLSRREKKRISVIDKLEHGIPLLMDISRGIIQDGVHTNLPMIHSCNTVLKKGEICHYYGKVQIAKSKNVVVGNVRQSSGVSLGTYHKGLSTHMRSGQSQTQVVRGDMVETTPAMLCITNKRIILTSAKYGLDKSLSQLTSVTRQGSQGMVLQCGETIYNLTTKFPVLITEIIAVAVGNY